MQETKQKNSVPKTNGTLTQHQKYLEQNLVILSHKVEILEKAMLHIVNALDEKKQVSVREKLKANTKRTKS